MSIFTENKLFYRKKIEDRQKFLLWFLHLHIGTYFPLRKYLGIDYKGKIDDITDLSIGYNTKYFPKKGQWYKQQTRTYQHPDLGYKLNLLLDKIPFLVFPFLLQPAYGFLAMIFFGTTTTYQPGTKDSIIIDGSLANSNYGTNIDFQTGSSGGYNRRSPIHFDITDIADGATFSQGDTILYCKSTNASPITTLFRLTQTGWTSAGVTWNKYDGTTTWATAGGDFTSTNSVGITPTVDASNTWSSSALIQDCYDNASKNVHLLGKTTETLGEFNFFWSSDYTTDTSLRPKLTVTYTAPAAGGASLMPLMGIG